MAKRKIRKADGATRHFIKEWREFRQLSQEQLAARIDVSRGAISQLETGLTGYSQGMLEALADALACEPADLIMRNPMQDQMIWSLWEKLSEGERAQAIAVIKALKAA